jgi:hypothetical protein
VRNKASSLATVGTWIALTFALGGCATGSNFLPYPEQIRQERHQLRGGHTVTVAPPKKTATGTNALLHHLEKGRVAQVSGQREASLAHYEKAIELVQDREIAPLVGVTNTGRQGASLLINDNSLLYRGEGYEHILLHVFQALNYLLAGDLEGAAVEARRASAAQTQVRNNYERELEKLEQQIADRIPISAGDQSSWQAKFDITDTAAARAKNAFQVAYGYFITGLIFELAGYPDHAYIDYKRAFELAPSNALLQQSVMRLAHMLGHHDDVQALEAGGVEMPPPLAANEGELIVLYEQGLVPEKREEGLVFWWDERLLRLAFPGYPYISEPGPPLHLRTADGGATHTEVLTEVSALAARAMRDKRGAMLARHVARLIAKDKFYRKSEEQAGLLGAIVAGAYNVVSEQADLRSWLTLPATAQVGHLRLPAGAHEITLSATNVASQTVPAAIQPGARTIVHVVQAGSGYHITQTTIHGERL